MTERRVQAFVIVGDDSWHEAMVPKATIESILEVQKTGGEWEGAVDFRNDCKFASCGRVRIKDILIRQCAGVISND